jgi:arylsulfatase A-like enzyme
MKLSRIQVAAVFCLTAVYTTQAQAADQPNILVLYSDDAGYADFGFQPNCVEEMKKLTPNIDTIARDGVRLSSAYMSGCVCSPSRSGLMTGRYQQRFGFDNNLPPGTQNGLSLEETFGAKRMQKFGYTTGLVGKWHLGYPDAMHPNRRGFDWFYGLLQGSRGYFPYDKPSPHRVILENSTPTEESGYVTDRFGDAACRFITAHKEEPFFLFVSFTAPHGPNQPKHADLPRVAHIQNQRRANHVGLIVSLDDNVGKILKCLEEQGLDDNTLVVFTNDNGGQTQTGAKNTPLKGRKGTLHEGGVRVPWAMRWNGKIQPGSVIDDPIIALDILPTMVEMAGHTVGAGWKLDGVSLLDRITGQEASLPVRPLFWRQHGSQGNRAMREGKWKLYHGRGTGENTTLYDLSADISEANNLASENPEILHAMITKLDAWESQLIEPLWGKNAGESSGMKKKKSGKQKKQKQELSTNGA